MFATEGSSRPIVIMPTSITLDKNYIEEDIGFIYYLTAEILPENATNKTITWTTSNPMVATVDSNGKVEIVGDGVCTITAMTVNNLGATCAVKHSAEILPESIEITGGNSVEKNETLQLSAEILPANSTHKIVTWHSSDPAVATVDGNGLVEGVGGGSCIITATTINDLFDTHGIDVTIAPSNIELNLNDVTLYSDDPYSLYYMIPLEGNGYGGAGIASNPYKLKKKYDAVMLGIESDDVTIGYSTTVKVTPSNTNITFMQYDPSFSEYDDEEGIAELREDINNGFGVKLAIKNFISNIDFSITYTIVSDPTSTKTVYFTTKVA